MTADKLLELLEVIRTVEDEFGMQATLENISNTLSNLTNSPAEPTYQSALATHLAKLDKAVKDTSEFLTLSQGKAIESIGGEQFFDPNLAQNIRTSVSTNAMTPSVARDFVKKLSSGRAAFMATVNQTYTGLTALGINGYVLDEGGSDLSFIIPRSLFSNELGAFATELRFLDRLINDLSEATLGKYLPCELESLSTTTPLVSVITNPHVLAALAKAVGAFLAAWKTIEEIRKVRADVARIGVAAALEPFDEKIEETVAEVVEETVRVSLAPYGKDGGRRNELDTSLRQDFRRLFGQIERGLVVEFRARPEDENSTEASDPLIAVRDASKQFYYPVPSLQPLLLSNGELLEGEIVRTSKKTTTTTKIKRPAKGGPSD